MSTMGGASELPDIRTQVYSLKVTDLSKILGGLGLPKSGRKADLQTRILNYIGETASKQPVQTLVPAWQIENARHIIENVYLASMPKGYYSIDSKGVNYQSSNTDKSNGAKFKKIKLVTPSGWDTASSKVAIASSKKTEQHIRCICQGTQAKPNMVQCQECKIWQHRECLDLSTKADQAEQTSKSHYCEFCRAHLADPFWEPVETLLPPAKVRRKLGQPPVKNQYGELLGHQHLERALYLTGEQIQKAQQDKNMFRVAVGCILLEDEVPLRYHWPRNVNLRINSMNYRPYARHLTSKIGINQRDAPASIASLCFRGRNTIEMTAIDNGTWIVLVQKARKRSLEELKKLMLPEETLKEAKERIKGIMSSFLNTCDAQDPGDEYISVSCQLLSLNDPMSGQRIKSPARFSDASGIQSFDLDSFLSIVEKNRKWQDPTTLKNSNVRKLCNDAFVKRILDCLSPFPNVNEVEVNADGCWRPENSDGEWYDVFSHIDEIRNKVRTEIEKKEEKSAPSTNASEKVDQVTMIEDNSDTEIDEEAELREAAEAMQKFRGNFQNLPAKEPEVIVLIDSSDEDFPLPGILP